MRPIKKVANPLTVIAIFASLAEVFGIGILPLLTEKNQSIYMIFLMVFPLVTVIFFFITLNFNHKVLYSPSDYDDENNFMTISGYDLSNDRKTNISIEELLMNKSRINKDIIIEDIITTKPNRFDKVFNSSQVSIGNGPKTKLSNTSVVQVRLSDPYKKDDFMTKLDNSSYVIIDKVKSKLGYKASKNDYRENAALWIGKEVEYKKAIELIEIATERFPSLRYFKLSGDLDFSDAEGVNNGIFVGGSTLAANDYGLKPFEYHDLKKLDNIANQEEFHDFIRSFYAK